MWPFGTPDNISDSMPQHICQIICRCVCQLPDTSYIELKRICHQTCQQVSGSRKICQMICRDTCETVADQCQWACTPLQCHMSECQNICQVVACQDICQMMCWYVLVKSFRIWSSKLISWIVCQQVCWYICHYIIRNYQNAKGTHAILCQYIYMSFVQIRRYVQASKCSSCGSNHLNSPKDPGVEKSSSE